MTKIPTYGNGIQQHARMHRSTGARSIEQES